MHEDARQHSRRAAAAGPEAINAWLRSAPAGSVLRAQFDAPRYWLAGTPAGGGASTHGAGPAGTTAAPRLHALLQRDARGTRVAIAPRPLHGDIEAAAARQRVPVIDLERPVPLLPVDVPKPWGREVWFTGIEARGVCAVGNAQASVPLPDLLALAPEWICGQRHRSLVLLKILDPHADPDFGELYLELHEQKREVYVVTAVDRSLWPDGVGALRLGGAHPGTAPDTPGHGAAHPGTAPDTPGHGAAPARHVVEQDAAWRAAFRAAIARYEAVRRRLDGQLDELRAGAGIALDATLPLADARKLAARLPAALHAEEREARAAMHAFTRLHPLREGDTVAIPTHTPHALQPGVRVIEFQTPAYERRILAFTQKVLTQPHWDTDAAIASMRPHARLEPPCRLLDEASVQVDCIVDFPDFRVLRVHLQGADVRGGVARTQAACWQPPASDYAVCIGVSGQAAIEGRTLEAERAMFVPNPATRWPVTNAGGTAATFLWALPA